MKIIGLKTTSNIQTLIRDLFHSPPSFKSAVQLSWVKPKQRNVIKAAATEKVDEALATTTTAKRHAPITFSNGNSEDTRGPKQAKSSNGQAMYSPPGGKFSSKFGNNKGRAGGNTGNRSRNSGGNNQFRSGGGGGGPMRNKNFRRR